MRTPSPRPPLPSLRFCVAETRRLAAATPFGPIWPTPWGQMCSGTPRRPLNPRPTGYGLSQPVTATTPAACCASHANKESKMQYEERSDRFTAVEDRFAGYEVYDRSGSKIGKVDDLFVDEGDNPEYVGVKMGLLGTSSTLIPWEAVSSTDDGGRTITVATDKETAKNGPAFDDDREITPEFEQQVYSYYGLQSSSGTEQSGSYGSYYSEQSTEAGTVGPGMSMGDTETGEFRDRK